MILPRPPPRYDRRRDERGRGIAVVALATLVVIGSGLFAPATHLPASSGTIARAPSAHVPGSSSGAACGSSPSAPGDLIVGPGPGPCVIQASGLGSTYTQSGNVTVLPGGVLIIRNITFSIRQYVSNTGTPLERLSHIYAFRDEGSVQFWNATLTTDATVSNPYIKLSLNVTGQMSVWNSSFQFPGWIDVYGTTASLTLNGSTIEANPAASSPSYAALGSTIVADTSYAPSLSVQGGARTIMLNSTSSDIYADDTLTNGMPGILPLVSTLSFPVNPGSGKTIQSFDTSTSSTSLLQDWLYPTGIYSGYVQITYAATDAVSTQVELDYNGTTSSLNSIAFGPGPAGSTAIIDLTPAAVAAINHQGLLQFLNLTGAFSGTSAGISITFEPTTVGAANITQVQLILLPLLDYDVVIAGQGSSLTVGAATIGLNWNALPSSPVSQSAPYPWDSNKLVLEDEATARLASLIIHTPNPGPSATSAILPDSTSAAYVYRWASFPVGGRGGIPVPGAHVSAYYSTAGGNNATVTALNNLSSNDPVLWSYVQEWDSSHAITSYGTTPAGGPTPGVGFLLLVADNLTEATLPSGIFLGSYNVKIAPPIPDVASHSFSFSLTPYPGGLTNGSADQAPTSAFPQYAAGLSIGTLEFTVQGIPSSASLRIGQTIGVEVPLLNSGTAPVENISASLAYEPPSGGSMVVAVLPLRNESIPSNGTSMIGLEWNVSESQVGDLGVVSATLVIEVVWNGGPSIGDGGSVMDSAPIQIKPSLIRITSLPVYPSRLEPNTEYSSDATVAFNGTGSARILLTAFPLSGRSGVRLTATNSTAGSFTISFNSSVLQAGVLYAFGLNASYNTAFAPSVDLPGDFSLIEASVPRLVVSSITMTANGLGPTTSVRIGQVLGIDVELFNDGTGATRNLSGTVVFLRPSVEPVTPIALLPLTNVSIAAGAPFWANFTWTVTELVVGEVGPVSASVTTTLVWDRGLAPGGGSVNATAALEVQPSEVRIVTFQPYPSTLQVDSNYTSPGTIAFNGSAKARVELIATPAGGSPFLLADTNSSVGTFNLTFSSSRLLAGIVYTLSVGATYNTASAPVYGVAGTVSLAAGSSSAPSSGLWIWVAAGAAALLAIILLALILRRGRRSESQECGECGALVTAEEQTCPRCGTWFETKPLPCPSCGAAIPADVVRCPECATEAPDRPTVVRASGADRQAYEEFVSHYRAAATGELGEDYPEAEFWAWWKQQPSYYSFRAWRKREERDSHPIDPPAEPEPSDEEVF